MEGQTLDRIARIMAKSTNRRTTLGMAAAMAAAVVGGRFGAESVLAGPGCATSDECDPGMVCEGGFCLYPACYGTGESCSSHDDCCDDNLCLDGICGASTRCGLETEGCGADSDCCPGLACLGGICAIAPPPPPETGGSGSGGTGNGGGTGTNSGGGGQTSGEYLPPQGSAPSGTTSSGVSVAALPTTGSGTAAVDERAWKVVAGIAAAVALITGRKTASSSDSDQSLT